MVVLLVVAVGCGGGETVGVEREVQDDGVFVYGRAGDSVSLDPINATDDESFIVTSQVFDGLLEFAPGSTEVVPALATGVPEPERGGLVYTFRLREGVEFHDGTRFDADAVVFNFDRWRYSNNEFHVGGGATGVGFAYFSEMFGGFDGRSVIEGVEAVDEHTVRFTLREPQGAFLRNIAMSPFGIGSPRAIRDDAEGFWRKPVGTGAFRFDSWDEGDEIRLDANEEWWGSDVATRVGGGGPNVDSVVFRTIPDDAERLDALVSGQLSAADGLTPDGVAAIDKEAGLKVAERPALNVGYLAMNTREEPFDDLRVRLAVAHAVNMPEIVAAFHGGESIVATSPVPPTVAYFNDRLRPYRYDPSLARRLLADAGLPNGFETELWYLSEPEPYMPAGRGTARAMQRDLANVGIRVELVTREFGTYLEETGRGEHPMAQLGWIGDNGDPDNFLNELLSGSTATEENAQNIAFYWNPEVDALLEIGRMSVDEAERERVYTRAQEIIHADAPWLPIAYTTLPVGLQDDVEGFQPSPTGNEGFNTIRVGRGS